jgi:hypothetical protein
VTYFADLTPYTYFDGEADSVNVGWLEPGHPMPTGDAPSGFVERLTVLAEDRVNQTRGPHVCGFCVRAAQAAGDDGWFAYVARGSAEFRVHGPTVTYAVPQLIVHYVTDHNYLPPKEFCDAVLRA